MPKSARWWAELQDAARKSDRESLRGDELVEVCNDDEGVEDGDYPALPPGSRTFFLTRLFYEGEWVSSGWKGSRQKARGTFARYMGMYLKVGRMERDEDAESVMSDASHLSTLADLDDEPALSDSEGPVELREASSFYEKDNNDDPASAHSGSRGSRAPLAELNQDGAFASPPTVEDADASPPKRRRRQLELFGGLRDVEETPPPEDERAPEEEGDDVDHEDITQSGEDDDGAEGDDAEFGQLLANFRRNRPTLDQLIGPPPPVQPAPPALLPAPPVQQQQPDHMNPPPAANANPIVLPQPPPPGPALAPPPPPIPAALLQGLLPAGTDLQAPNLGRDLLAILKLLVRLATPTPLTLAKSVRRLSEADLDGMDAGASPLVMEMDGEPSKGSLTRIRSALSAASKLIFALFNDGYLKRSKIKATVGYLASLCSVYGKVLGRGRRAGEEEEVFAARMGRVAGTGLGILDDIVSAVVVKKVEPDSFRGHVVASAAAAFASRLVAEDLGAEHAAVAALAAKLRTFLLSAHAH